MEKRDMDTATDTIIDRALKNKEAWDLANDDQLQRLLTLRYLRNMVHSLVEISASLARIQKIAPK